MVLMPGFQSTRLATDGALEPFYFLYTDDSIQGNPETCKQSSIMLNYEIKNTLFTKQLHQLFLFLPFTDDHIYAVQPILQIASLNGHLCHIWRPACDLNGGQPRTH